MKRGPAIDTSETRKVIKDCYEQFRSNTFEDLVEMGGFLKIYGVLEVTGEVESLNGCVIKCSEKA